MEGLKTVFNNANEYPNELWKALNEKSCSPIELDELCEDLYQYLDEYGFAIIILALRQRILQLDRDFLNQMPKTMHMKLHKLLKIESFKRKLGNSTKIIILKLFFIVN